MKNRSIIILFSVLLIIILSYPRIKNFFQIDSCLDSGGRWNHEKGQCEYSTNDSVNLTGYNELANEQNRNSHTLSEYNTDLEKQDNIKRPKTSEFINPSIDTALLFGIWAQDTTGPHADFWLKNSEFYVVDYDGDGSMPFILKKDSLTVYYNDFKITGIVKYVGIDSLLIRWENTDGLTTYYKWRN